MSEQKRANPDEILQWVQDADQKKSQGQLRIFFGMSAGVGKTYAMLQAAHEAVTEGRDVVIGVVETHGRLETESLLPGLAVWPLRKISYRGAELHELDLEGLLERAPELVIVDELAHTNVPGVTHVKRYQDVLQLLAAGIDVYTAVNVQHLESRKEAVEKITGVAIRETVPDSILERANHIELIDITPQGLLKRLGEGKVYLGERAQRAQQNFFKEGPLTALREISLRVTAEKVDRDLQDYGKLHPQNGPWNTNERLMVAVSHSPYSERLIRSTRRYASSLEAPWLAVNIDVGQSLSRLDQAQLSKNLNLARELGAEVVTRADTDMQSALRSLAKERHVTQMILGRPTQRFFRDHLQGGTLLDRLVRESGEFDVHVVRHESPVTNKRRRWEAFEFFSDWIQYWHVLWILSLVSVLNSFFYHFAGYRSVGFVYLAAVLGLGFVFSMGPVILAAALSALFWNYFFIPPRFTFAISSSEDILLCLFYFVVAVTTGFLMYRIRKHELIFKEREERTRLLYQITKDLTAGSSRDVYLQKVATQLVRLFECECGFILADGSGGLDFQVVSEDFLKLSSKEQAVAQWAFEQKKAAGWSTDNLPLSRYLYVPLNSQNQVYGVLVFKPRKMRRLTQDQESLLWMVAQQVAASLEKENFEAKSKLADRLRESEKLHQALMNSLSHEMKTPLTALMGSMSALGQEDFVGTPELRRELREDVLRAGQRLNRVIENLLDMTRVQAGVLTLKKDWFDIRELLDLTRQRYESELRDHPVRLAYDEVPLVKVDHRLLEQVFSNILLNAAAYTPKGTEIDVRVAEVGGELRVSLRDHGPGIPADSVPVLFEKFYRVPGSRAGGTGLGLYLVKNFIEAHGGRIAVRNHPEGGAEFVVTLPLETVPPMPEEMP